MGIKSRQKKEATAVASAVASVVRRKHELAQAWAPYKENVAIADPAVVTTNEFVEAQEGGKNEVLDRFAKYVKPNWDGFKAVEQERRKLVESGYKGRTKRLVIQPNAAEVIAVNTTRG